MTTTIETVAEEEKLKVTVRDISFLYACCCPGKYSLRDLCDMSVVTGKKTVVVRDFQFFVVENESWLRNFSCDDSNGFQRSGARLWDENDIPCINAYICYDTSNIKLDVQSAENHRQMLAAREYAVLVVKILFNYLLRNISHHYFKHQLTETRSIRIGNTENDPSKGPISKSIHENKEKVHSARVPSNGFGWSKHELVIKTLETSTHKLLLSPRFGYNNS